MKRAGSFAVRLLIPAMMVTACATPAPDNGAPVDVLIGEATVEFVDLEGGCWTLNLAGERLLPLALPDTFRVDGLQVQVRLHPVEAATICMMGRTVKIESIEQAE